MMDTATIMQSYASANLNTLSKLDKQKLDDAKLKEQTDAFESLMIKEVLNIALKDNEKKSLFPKTAGSDIYKSMQIDAYSRSLSGGFGFSQMLYDFLKQRG